MPRFDPYGPPELHARPQLPRNYGDAFAPPQPTGDLFGGPGFMLPPGGGMGMRPPYMGRGGGRGGGGLGPFGGGGFI